MGDDRNKTAGFLVLRLFLAQFWVLQMIGKARDQESGITSLHNLVVWSANVTGWMAKTTPLPAAVVRPYTLLLPWLELAAGLMLLCGLRTREVLIGSGLLLISLDVGLMFQLKHDVVALNTVILLASLLALQWSGQQVWSLDALLRRNRRP